jgi:hypothetical protein
MDDLLKSILPPLILSIPGMIGLWISLKKMTPETTKTTGDAASSAAAAAKIFSDQVIILTGKIDALEKDHAKKVEDLEKCQNELEGRIQICENENRDLKDWAARLVHQVKSMGGVPVELKRSRGIITP